ncbi:MAG: hypothetical protein N2039_07370, partial [Gemmataceae bacterium]|nr:hypothetical protein [Gemmataceae bacterium]
MLKAWVVCGIAISAVIAGASRLDAQGALLPESDAPGRAVARAASPVYPNLLIEVGQDFVNALASRVESRTGDINRREDKTHTVGVQLTTVR